MRRVTYQELPGATPLVVTHLLIVKQDHLWVLHVHGHRVNPSDTPSLRFIPTVLSTDSDSLLLRQIADLRTCIDNPEQEYTDLG